MKNSIFDFKISKKNGGINHIALTKDEHKMNFCKSGRMFCVLNDYGDRINNRGASPFYAFILDRIKREGKSVVAYYSSTRGVDAVTEYTLHRDKISVCTTLTNKNSYPVYYREGDLTIDMPINDAYESSEICMRERAHAHIWAGGNVCYVRAERMGLSDKNIGIFFTKGNIASYSQQHAETSNRGYFELNLAPFVVGEGKSVSIEYFFFTYKDKKDFFNTIRREENYLDVVSENGYTVEAKDKICLKVCTKNTVCSAEVSINGKPISFKKNKKSIAISYKPRECGEHRIDFEINGVRSFAIFNVISSISSLVEKRLQFIVDKQQCLDKNSSLYGAYLIYDNEEKMQYCNTTWPDYSACRERFGMAISLVAYLRRNFNRKMKESLELFVEFLLRECVDEKEGYVYSNIGKDSRKIRLYNPPWVILFFSEYYMLTREVRWANLVVTILKYYYNNGGARFYPNGIRFTSFFEALKSAGLTSELDEILPMFDKHVETIVKNGTNYPPHEVNFEQTIVTPAVSILLDKYQLSGDKFYLEETKKHLEILGKFDGAAPDPRLDKIPIRFWDDYWFGKSALFGDTLHYWSVLSGFCFYLYGKISGKDTFVEYGRQCVMNCTYLFKEDGSASCAYLYPKKVNGARGAHFDTFANDQDFALYFMIKMFLS